MALSYYKKHSQSIKLIHENDGFFLYIIHKKSYSVKNLHESRVVPVTVIPAASQGAVMNANYMMHKLIGSYDMACGTTCMHEFVMTLEQLKHDTGVSAMDVAKRLLDFGMHPPTMYFPLMVHEALMVEPTETESPETLDAAAEIFLRILEEAKTNGESLHNAPHTYAINRPDEVKVARTPVLRYVCEET